jgi:hypothetical protein
LEVSSRILDSIIVDAMLVGEGIQIVPGAKQLLSKRTLELLESGPGSRDREDMFFWRRQERGANQSSEHEALIGRPRRCD